MSDNLPVSTYKMPDLVTFTNGVLQPVREEFTACRSWWVTEWFSPYINEITVYPAQGNLNWAPVSRTFCSDSTQSSMLDKDEAVIKVVEHWLEKSVTLCVMGHHDKIMLQDVAQHRNDGTTHWLLPEDVCDIGARLGIGAVPTICIGDANIRELLADLDSGELYSRVYPDDPAQGICARSVPALYCEDGTRVAWKCVRRLH
jgi:hypothetical protein